MKEPSKDLMLCYNNILDGFCKRKKIAISPLGTEVGFPRDAAAQIAVKTVFDFIKNNPGIYDVVELFVNKRSEFALYKELLENASPKMLMRNCL